MTRSSLRSAVFAAPMLALLGACSTDSGTARLEPEDFYSGSGAPPALSTAQASGIFPPSVLRTGPIAAAEGLVDVRATPGPPELPAREPSPVEPASLVDAKVGDINGKPIYAAAFLEPLIAELQAKAAEFRRANPTNPRAAAEAWYRHAGQRIFNELDRELTDELLRAESLSMLTPQQRQGFLNVMRLIENDLLSSSGGSRALAEQRLREQEGRGVEEWLQSEQDKELIKFNLRQRLVGRFNIARREMKVRYEREADRFNPPPRATFKMLAISADRAADIAACESALRDGAAFDSFWNGPLNVLKPTPEGGGLVTRELKPSMAETDFFGRPELNEPARALTPGQWAGPIKSGSFVRWIYLERIEQDSKPFYDAQTLIEDELKDERFDAILREYMKRLKERASFTKLELMTERLVSIAAERCFASERASDSGRAPADAGSGASSLR